MPESLDALEAERSRILLQLSSLGDFRSGSICPINRRCGKPSCHCAKPGDSGHDPQVRLTHKAGGKTVAETISSAAALHKANAEIAEFRRFRELSADLTTVNEKICRLRPVENAPAHWTPEEKKRLLRSISRSRGK
jgi:hypothetical protein